MRCDFLRCPPGRCIVGHRSWSGRRIVAVNTTQLRALLRDCLTLWEVAGVVSPGPDGLFIETDAGRFSVAPAEPDLRPVRWFYQTPERASAGRPPRAVPSVVELLAALRNAMEGAGGDRLRVGGG